MSSTTNTTETQIAAANQAAATSPASTADASVAENATAGTSPSAAPTESVAGAASEIEVAAETEKKAVENEGHAEVHSAVASIEAFFSRIGKDISAEITAIKAKL